MKLYRFSPIEDQETILEAYEHTYKSLTDLREASIDEDWPVYTLKIFAHYDEEYKFLFNWINSIGFKDMESSKTSYYVKPHKPFIVGGQEIPYVGLRTPDPYRAQVGCGDFEVNNYAEIKKRYLGRAKNLREVDHQKYEMLELFNPDIDVLGYIVKE